MAVAVVDSLVLDAPLANTGYSVGWTLATVREHDQKFVKALGDGRVKSVNANDISEGKGVLSRVFRVVIQFEDIREYTFMMKIPTIDYLDDMLKHMEVNDEEKETLVADLKATHIKECDAYNLLKNIQNFPKCDSFYVEYADAKTPGVIMMCDMSETATTIEWFDSATQQHCLNLAQHFANFQAQISVVDGWRGKYPKSYHTGAINNKAFPQYMEKLAKMNKEFVEPVKKFSNFDFFKFSHYALKELPEEFGAIILCHGDAGPNNIMMLVADDGVVTDEISCILDWQILFEGNPLHDLARFMRFSADAEIRHGCEKQAVNLYYDTLCEALEKLDAQPTFKREQAHLLYEYAAIQQTFEFLGVASSAKSHKNEKVSEEIFENRCEKLMARAWSALNDAIQQLYKQRLFERFQKE